MHTVKYCLHQLYLYSTFLGGGQKKTCNKINLSKLAEQQLQTLVVLEAIMKHMYIVVLNKVLQVPLSYPCVP